MGRRSDIPWGDVKTEYVTTSASYSALAKKYGTTKRDVGEHGRNEGWVAERERFRNETAAKIEEARQQESIDKGLAAIREIGNVATDSIRMIRDQIAGAGNGTQAEAAVSALRGLLLIIRDCYGILTAQEQARVDLDRDKLNLEREKYNAGKNEERVLQIMIDGPGEYYD